MTGSLALLQMTQEELRHEILHEWEIGRTTWRIPIEVFGVDLSINKIIWYLWAGAIITFLILFIGSRLLKDRPGAYQVIVEEIYAFGRNHLGAQMGEEGRKFYPYTLTLFVFILTLNLLGLTPLSYPVTSNLSFTFALAILTFLITQYVGIRRHGFRYFKEWVPHGLPEKGKFVLAPFMWVIHLISEFSKPLTLGLRLYANMLAGHLIIFVFLSLILYFGLPTAVVSVPAALAFYAFEVFIAVLQAYIFAILSQLYIELALFGEGGAEEEHGVDASARGAEMPAA
ncbi:MAG: F0F1 ATP synthase subunit A [Actinomycetota bacterium]